MKLAITIHGMAKRKDKKGRPVLSLLINHPKLKEPTWVPASILTADDGAGDLIYNARKPIPRKVEIAAKHAKRLGLA